MNISPELQAKLLRVKKNKKSPSKYLRDMGFSQGEAEEIIKQVFNPLRPVPGMAKLGDETWGVNEYDKEALAQIKAMSGYDVHSLLGIPEQLAQEEDAKFLAWVQDYVKTKEAIAENSAKVAKEAEEVFEPISHAEDDKGYTYNEVTDKYVVYGIKAAPKPVIVPGATHRALVAAYSNWTGEQLTINELSRKFGIPRQYFNDYKRIFGLTHDREPVTIEEIQSRDPDQIVNDILEKKRFILHQKFEKADWKATQEAAKKWNEFQAGTYDPFELFMSSWDRCPEYVPIDRAPIVNRKPGTKRKFVAGAFDWHVGGRAEKRYLFKGQDWNVNEAKKAVEKYTQKVGERVAGLDYDGCVIVLGGDLYNSITGFTANGTPMNNDYSRDTQFDAICGCLIFFISRMLEIFGKVDIHFVRGNHGGTTDYPLGMALKFFFRTEERITFNVYSERTAAFRVLDTLVLIDHGASDQTKHLIPQEGKARESYIQHLLLSKPELLVGAKQKIFIQGDLHHYQQKEYADFEYFMFGSLPIGDQFSDAKGLHNRPRQNCLDIDEDGVTSVHHFYLDC